MLNKLAGFIRREDMLHPGERVICAVSGGADSMALLFAMYLLAPKLQITLCAAHFNHKLRGEESDADEAFVKSFCHSYQIPVYIGSETVTTGKKGLEAAARDARYRYLRTLPGKILTAHTADDNAETVLMHLLRGTGLKGLCGIRPVSGNILRPMLQVTRADVLAFLEEYHIPYVLDSSNDTDAFLRNRLRHNVMPLLARENPKLAENVSDMALRLREEESVLEELALSDGICTDVPALRQMRPFRRRRILSAYLQSVGVREPEAAHVCLLEKLVFASSPSARAEFPGGVTVARNYDALEVARKQWRIQPQCLPCPGSVELPELGLRISAEPAQGRVLQTDRFTVFPEGAVTVRCRQPSDEIRLSGGRKSLKKLFIDKKIPAAKRSQIPVLSDERGVLGVYGFGANLERVSDQGVCITFEVL